MPHVPYVSADLAEPKDIVAAVRARRGGHLTHLDRMLLHSPQLAAGWNSLLGAVRGRLSLDARMREIAICAVASLNGAEYEFHHHAPELLKAGGDEHQVRALRDVASAANNGGLFTEAQRAALQLTLEMTDGVAVNDDTMEWVKNVLPDSQAVVELVATIATYNMVSRFLVALDVHADGDKPALSL
ncbi:MAG: carboxymuconolactone decarboxylase family protein [Burkholderiales bacterium]|nr:carboxymuconolactone decarboxylase family protein [Burkholderiales bacterium]